MAYTHAYIAAHGHQKQGRMLTVLRYSFFTIRDSPLYLAGVAIFHQQLLLSAKS